MVGLTVVLSGPLSWSARRPGGLGRAVTVLAALVSVVLGAAVLMRALTEA
jgi:hypothetical protein